VTSAAPSTLWTLLSIRDYRLSLTSRLLMTLASMIQSVAVGWQVYSITRDPLDLGLVGLAQFAPLALLVLVAGQAADRLNRKGILIGCNLAEACAALGLLSYALTNPTEVWPIFLLVMITGAARAFAGPAAQALSPRLVPPILLPPAIALNSSTWQASAIIGPAFGGFLYAWGAELTYAAAAVGFFLAGLAVASIRTSGKIEGAREPASWTTLVAGIRYVRQNRPILGAITLDLFAVLVGGATALLPAYAKDILHTGPEGLGLLRAAPAVGAVIVGLLLVRRPLTRNAGRLMFLCVGLFGLATAVFGISTWLPLSLAALVVVGAADMVSVYVRQTLIQLWTPDEMRGRVAAVSLVCISASNELGEFQSGLAAALVGVMPAVVLGGLGAVAVTLLYVRWFPELYQVQSMLPEEASQTPK
jgi:MFS family permease